MNKCWQIYQIRLVYIQKSCIMVQIFPKKAKFGQIASSPRLFTPTCKYFYTNIFVIFVTFRNSVLGQSILLNYPLLFSISTSNPNFLYFCVHKIANSAAFLLTFPFLGLTTIWWGCSYSHFIHDHHHHCCGHHHHHHRCCLHHCCDHHHHHHHHHQSVLERGIRWN